MASLMLHHVSIVAIDLERSIAFYRDLFDVERIERPPFPTAGAWFVSGGVQFHIIVYVPGSFRTGNVDTADLHFAFRTDDFDGFMSKLAARGFHEDGDEGDLKHIIVRRSGLAGFSQVYLLDPDRNIVEVNGAPPIPV
jgi:glyoxylase I family protein